MIPIIASTIAGAFSYAMGSQVNCPLLHFSIIANAKYTIPRRNTVAIIQYLVLHGFDTSPIMHLIFSLYALSVRR